VISDELLKQLTAEQAPRSVAEYKDESGAVDSDVTELRIDFQNILKIDNLITFTNLVKLQLDNNLIERIENLDHLVNLQWLDLSFNNIERIEGLEHLSNITDLSLHHNQISTLEGLDALHKLDVLSIGDNQLETVESAPVLYLRRFHNLRSLNMSGNQLTEDPDYETFVIAFLPTLKYIDWKRISDETREGAVLKYSDKLEITKIKEAKVEELLQEERDRQAHADKYTSSCVPNMFGSGIFDSMLDKEIPKLYPIPDCKEAVDTFRDLFNEAVDAIGARGLENAATRKTEREMFFSALQEGIDDNRESGRQLIDEFITKKNASIVEIEGLIGTALAADKLVQLRDDLQSLKEQLMELEMSLVAMIEESTSLFDRSYAEMVQQAAEEMQEKMSKMREAEETCYKQVNDIAVAFLDKQIKGELTEGVTVTDELLVLLRDKTTLTAAITGGHDQHLMVIDDKEDELGKGLRAEYGDLITKQTDSEAVRNRNRIAEIQNFFQHHEKHLLDLDGDDDD